MNTNIRKLLITVDGKTVSGEIYGKPVGEFMEDDYEHDYGLHWVYLFQGMDGNYYRNQNDSQYVKPEPWVKSSLASAKRYKTDCRTCMKKKYHVPVYNRFYRRTKWEED